MSLLASGAAACGRQETKAKSAASTVATSDLTEAAFCGAAALTDASVPASTPAAPALRHVPAEQLRLDDGGAPMTLCDLMRSRGKALTLLQFVSVKCFACMKWIESVNSGLEDAGLLTQVQPIVIMTDRVETLSDDEARRLKRDIAYKAVWVSDYFGDLWSFFSTGDPGPVGATPTPLLIAIDADERGFVLEDPTLEARAIVAMASDAMALGIKATAPVAAPAAAK